MITNFENYTHELTPDELALLPVVMDGFSRHGSTDPIKSADIIPALNKYITRHKLSGIVMNDVRLRKFVHHIRSLALLPLIGTSSGYYVATDPAEIDKQIQSLEQRARSIMFAAVGLKNYISHQNQTT